MTGTGPRPDEEAHLIHVEEEKVVIENHPEDWLAFGLFWALAFIVFLQFFTRYVLNDSLSWTEEIARYGLMAVVFIGAIMVTRRHSHISVVLLPNLLPAGVARVLLAIVDLVTLVFLALLGWFGVLIVERMQIQRMTVFDVSMAYVYGVIALGCLLMFARQVQRVSRNARDLWRGAQRDLTAGLVIDDREPRS
ncbi:MAG: TRAP transporter small permease [Alphaproteobacteria bacterium]|nr:TRAP transporter small permease [Alphaproteobacteria bacterium]